MILEPSHRPLEAGNAADMFIDKRGPGERPERVLDTRRRERLDITESIGVRFGRVEEL